MPTLFGAFTLPNGVTDSTDHQILRDSERTASGVLRQDFLTYKRAWNVKASWMTPSQRTTLINLLVANDFVISFETDELAGPVTSRIEITGDEADPYQDSGGTWQRFGRTMRFLVTEV
jgi:hypothetical protein